MLVPKFPAYGGPLCVEGDNGGTIAEKFSDFREMEILIFKGSYRKPSFETRFFTGIGDEKALKILRKVGNLGVPVVTDIHEAGEAAMAAAYVDVLRYCFRRQTDLLVATASTGKVVNIKKGQFIPDDEVCRRQGA